MKSKIFNSLLMGITVILGSLSLSTAVYAAPTTPADIFSTVETGSVEIILKNALYPITSSSTRTWTIGDVPVTIDNVNFKDNSKNQNAVLTISNLTTAFHSTDVRVKDTTTPAPAITIDDEQFARLYVISKENVNNATLEIKDVKNRVSGDTLEASSLALYINGYAFPNFQTLAFVIDGNLSDSITVPDTSTTYTVMETITGKTLTCNVVGIQDTNPPVISKLLIKNSLENKYALSKELEVEANDDDGLPLNPYYWEKDASFALYLKEEVSSGKKSKDLIGLSWTDADTFTATANGKYTVFVRDKAGNIAYRDIEVTKISATSPTIYYVTLGKESDDVYLDVNAYDDDGQPLSYKLNKGKWQTSSRLYNVSDGTNTIYVRNEAGVEVKTTKEVYLDLYKGKVGEFSSENLRNYIVVSPATWTNKSVTVSLKLPDSVKKYLSSTPYAINGEKYSTTNNYTTSTQGEIVQFSVQDVYGKTYTANDFVVSNIDKDIPSIMAVQDSGNITVTCQDALSGVTQILVSGKGLNNYILKANGTGLAYDSVIYKAPANGSYQFVVIDAAGNTANTTISVDCYAENTVQNNYTKTSKTSTIKGSSKSNNSSTGKKNSSVNGSSLSSSSNSEDDDEEGTEVLTTTADDSSYVSNAGRSETREEKTVEKIVVDNKDGSAGSSSEAVMIKTLAPDNKNLNALKKLIWIVPVIILGSVVVVVIINKKK